MKNSILFSIASLGAGAAVILPGVEHRAEALASTCFTSSDPAASSSTYQRYSDTQFANGIKGTNWVTPSSVTDQTEFNTTFATSNLRFHTLGNTSVDAAKTCDHTRWYQTSSDNKIQAFRLFEGETAEGPSATSNISARVEAFTKILGWDGIPDTNTRYFWKGRFQIANAAQASLFQLKQNSGNDWAAMLRMDDDFNVYIRPRTGTTVKVGSVKGKKFNLRVEEVRSGSTFTVDWSMSVEVDGELPVTVSGTRNFSNAPTNDMQFRWGVYQDGTTLTPSGTNGATARTGNKLPAKFARVRVAGARWGKAPVR